MVRRPSVVDVAIGLGILAMGQVEAWMSAPGHWRAADAAAAGVVGVALMWRRLYPTVSSVIVLVALAITVPLPLGPTWPIIALALTMYSAARYASTPRAVAVLGGGLGICALVTIHGGAVSFEQFLANTIFSAVLMVALPWSAGAALRRRALQSHEDTAAAVEQERRRIARELHDVISHSLSVIAVQAAAEQATMADSLPESTRRALAAIEQASHEALAEVRRLVTVTRSADAAATDEPVPARSVANIEGMLQGPRATGWTVHVHVLGDPVPLSPGMDLAGYRIVQEAVTNAVRHSRSKKADITVEYLPTELRLEVTDGGGSKESTGVGGRFGLVGMRERAALYGGRVTTRRNEQGGFVLEARLPYQDSRAGFLTPSAIRAALRK